MIHQKNTAGRSRWSLPTQRQQQALGGAAPVHTRIHNRHLRKSSSLGFFIGIVSFVLMIGNVSFCATFGASPAQDQATQQEKSARASSEPTPATKPQPTEQNPRTNSDTLTNEQSTEEVMTFVRQHVPELRPLLRTLKNNRPAQFQSAMRGLSRDVSDLNQLKARNSAKYEIALELWITKSKLRLAIAKLAVAQPERRVEQAEAELKPLIKRQIDLRKKLIAFDIEQASKRLERLNEQLEKLNTERPQEIERQIQAALRSANRADRANRSKQKSSPGKEL